MLLNLEILNGNLSPYFDIFVDTYTIRIDKSVNNLELNYEVEEGFNVEVINNENLKEGENLVYIEVFNETSKSTYTLEVYKEEAKEVINYDDAIKAIEVQKPMPKYLPWGIFICCLFVIMVTFCLLFLRKKKK